MRKADHKTGRTRNAALAFGCAAIFLVSPTGGRTQTLDQSGEQHEVFLTGYIFGSAISGRASAFEGLPPADLDLSFSDVVADLNFGLMAAIEVRDGRWSFLADMMYSQLSPAGAVPGPIPIEVDLRQNSLTLQGQILYRVAETPDIRFDLGGGLRYWALDNEGKVRGPVPFSPVSESKDWIDPLVAARVTARLDDAWSLTLAADVGGWSQGSDLTYQLLGTVNYLRNDHLIFRAGYRVLDVDYADGDFVYDIQMRGPVIGISYRF